MTGKQYPIIYDFILTNGQQKRFEILLDSDTLLMIRQEQASKPNWTRLEYHQCENCPLDTTTTTHCPVAVNIADIVEEFKDMVSSDECKARCHTPERIYLKKTSIMEGLTSIFGIIMATSNCPVLDFFKPMARFHLPFSTAEETMVRSTSMFLLRQYFKTGEDNNPGHYIKKLEEHYAKVKTVNEGLFKRISTVGSEDADKNAIVMLHSLSQLLCVEINYSLDSLKYLFDPVAP